VSQATDRPEHELTQFAPSQLSPGVLKNWATRNEDATAATIKDCAAPCKVGAYIGDPLCFEQKAEEDHPALCGRA
jgi:hypothetical protein